MRRIFVLLFALIAASSAAARTRVVLLQFTDYHAHALPFYSEGKADQGGVARAIGYLERERRKGALVFSGGDMINKGSPAWSDKFGCTEWPWFNRLVDAMALGNHDVDYGTPAFRECREKLDYPILSANTEGFPASAIFHVGKLRIGVFAVAGSDFPALVKAGLSFSDRIAAARRAVSELRDRDKVDAVVMIGHEGNEDDAALAQAVPGIDVIFGSHSHLKEPMHRIPSTNTWTLSPSQYLTYISRIEMVFDGKKLVETTGQLVPVDSSLPISKRIAENVAAMQRQLESDPEYAPLFKTIATLKEALPVDQLATKVLDVMRERTGADIALSTSSSFRQALPPGRLTLEDLRAALPYDNEIVVAEMKGDAVKRLLAVSAQKKGTDNVAFVAAPPEIVDDRTYRVATNDYLAYAVAGYRDFFKESKRTGLKVRDEFRKTL